MKTMVGGLLALFAVLVPAACGGGRPPALERLGRATLEPGVGLGSLVIGTTTLAAFTTDFPGGRPATTVGDNVGFEFTFPDERIAVLFMAAEACHQQVSGHVRELNALLRTPGTFLSRFPACASTPLTSVTAEAGPTAGETFFTGTTDGGVRLFSSRADVITALGESQDVRGVEVAGFDRQDSRREEFYYQRGLLVAVGESLTGPTAGRLVVEKIAVFPSQAAR